MPAASARLLRAADAERQNLSRDRGALLARRERLRAELEAVEDELLALEERAVLLDRLAPPSAATRTGASREGLSAGDVRALRPLRGTAVRVEAVRALVASGRAHEPLHYREWFDLLRGRGLEVAGRDPLAVFLTQISRSPLVRRTTTPGTYVLDRDAPARLRRELATHHAELRGLIAGSESRERREWLVAAIGRTERALDEAQAALAS